MKDSATPSTPCHPATQPSGEDLRQLSSIFVLCAKCIPIYFFGILFLNYFEIHSKIFIECLFYMKHCSRCQELNGKSEHRLSHGVYSDFFSINNHHQNNNKYTESAYIMPGNFLSTLHLLMNSIIIQP